MNHLSKYSNLLSEAASSLLYHYIDSYALYELLKYNRLRTCEPETYLYDNGDPDTMDLGYINGENVRFISLTRNPNPSEGYPVVKYGEFGDGDTFGVCRLTIDGDVLNTYCNFKDDNNKQQNMKVKPIDWAYNDGVAQEYGATNGKTWMMYSDDSINTGYLGSHFDAGDNKYSDKYHHPYSQAEDRLLTKAKYIPNANKYIKCIDIFKRKNPKSEYDNTNQLYKQEMNYIKKIVLGAKRLGIPVKIHKDIMYFKPNYNI